MRRHAANVGGFAARDEANHQRQDLRIDAPRVDQQSRSHPAHIPVAVRERFEPRRLWCVFQPHQHSRTRFLLADFARSFELADHTVVPRIYFVRDSERERQAIHASDLVEQVCAGGGRATHIPDFGAIVEMLLDRLRPGDLVVTMGAGDIWKVADELVRRLRDSGAR